ncbi:putative Glycosyl transferase group 1 [Candidatus Promineifilum breve]|uniref:Glycosyl transferase group 1 n=1 Tax=Candidatus Promineifilum breve TaxID=1806508 RepID=A0A160T0H2_9CHLR|nr:glycosyltransferase family 4 protein [Candidatus Promineifilum breve]CUS02569.2 putative Glycosyl transferase group 1 [Candidatus Promineifilum breve]
MRIGLVTGEYPPMEGGVGAFTEQLARALNTLGHEIYIITSRKARPADVSPQPAAMFAPIDLGYANLIPRVGRWRWPSLSAVAEYAIRYDLEVINLQYQAAAFNMRGAAIHYLPWRLKGIAPTVVTFHDLKTPYLFPKAGGLRERMVRDLARRARGVIATNAADQRRLVEWGVSAARQIPIGSNIDAYRPNHVELEEVRTGLSLPGDAILLGYFGFLNETKGADALIEALAQLDDRYHLVFIGGQTGASDPDNNQTFLAGLRQQIERLGVAGRVHWTGFLSPQRVSTYLVAADMMVMPYRDGVSPRRGTLMAVLAHGRPLITTAPVEATPEFRHGDNMWLVSPDDPQGLADAIAALAAAPSLQARLGEGARELAQAYSWDVIAARTADFLAEVVAQKGHT